MREPRHLEEEKEEALATKARLCSSHERGQWQLQKRYMLETVLNSQTGIFNWQFNRARLNCVQNIRQF